MVIVRAVLQVATVDPALVLVRSTHAVPVVPLLQELQPPSGDELGNLGAGHASLGEHWRHRRTDRGARGIVIHPFRISPGARVRTARSIAISRASTASASTCVAGAETSLAVGEVAKTTSPSNDVPTGVMRRKSAALAARATEPSATRSSAMLVLTTHSVVWCPATSSNRRGSPDPRAMKRALSSHAPSDVRAPAMMRP